METTFYHDEGISNNESVKRLKKTMTLDFNSSNTKQNKFNTLLQSPDLNLLKLASPELERMIIQANGMVTTTPTPTQFICPKYVTEEQEAYARGFVDALAELHKSNESDIPCSTSSITTTAASYPSTGTTTTSSQQLLTISSLPDSIVNAVAKSNLQKKNATPSGQPPVVTSTTDVVKLKEEPQTVPCLGSTPPLSPIDMASQERIKLERKRARNRIAARKCRTRKLERIARLEDRVKDLKTENVELVKVAASLREGICKVKQEIIEHINNGCQIVTVYL